MKTLSISRTSGCRGLRPRCWRTAITGEIASLAGAADDPRYFQISLPVQPGNSGGALVDDGGTYAAPTVCSAREIFRSPNFSNHKSTFCVTTGAPCSVAAESPTTMKRTRARSNAVSRRISFSANGSVAATDQTFLQSFQRRLFQQNQRVADIVAIGLRICRQNRLHSRHQPARPALNGCAGWSA